MSSAEDDRIAANVAQWTKTNREFTDRDAERKWQDPQIYWGEFGTRDAWLGDVTGLDVVELGAGTAYFSAKLARAGARPVAVDPTPAQLETARRMQQATGLDFPLIEAPAESVPLPDANTLYAIATHLAGSTEFWAVQMASGRDVGRHRQAEFRATGDGPALIARYERLIAAIHDALDNLPAGAMERIPPQPPAEYRSTGGLGETLTLRDCLLHAIEHGALHQGHIQITRQLVVDGMQSLK